MMDDEKRRLKTRIEVLEARDRLWRDLLMKAIALGASYQTGPFRCPWCDGRGRDDEAAAADHG